MIKVHNDGKEKDMSFEATCDLLPFLFAFGSTQEEAVESLKNQIDDAIKALQSLDYTDILQVDWIGNPIGAGKSAKT